MIVTSWLVFALLCLLNFEPLLNLFDLHFDRNGELVEGQAMNTSYDPFHLANSYGAFGTVGKERDQLVIEGTDSDSPDDSADWKEYPTVGQPWDPMRRAAVRCAVPAASRLAALVRGDGDAGAISVDVQSCLEAPAQ